MNRLLMAVTALAVGLFSLVPLDASAARNVCGDDRARQGEQCDGADLKGATCESLGYVDGWLDCASDCSWDTTGCNNTSVPICGDGLVDGAEECDGGSDLACPGACSDHCACPSQPPGDLEVHMVDVGQGDALVVISPDGFVLAVDAGDDGDEYAVDSFLASRGIYEIDYTLVSHLDADHVGGLDGLLAAHPEVTACFDHGSSRSTLDFEEYDLAAGDRRVAVVPGDVIDLGPSLVAEVLHADTGSSHENLNSVVLRLQYDDVGVLLGGDCEGPCEEAFDPRPTQIYKVHHHGASDSSSAPVLAAMDPWSALMSVGNSNSFGHPHADALARLADAQAEVWRTDTDGDLSVWSDGLAYTVNGAPVCTASDVRSCGSSDVGACSYGTRSCAVGMWDDVCVGSVEPVLEVCDNGVDDDCDGAIDGADGDCAVATTSVVLAQVAYDTPGTDSVEEFVDLFNAGTSDVDLSGWRLRDAGGAWTFPSGSLIGAGGWLSVARNQVGYEAAWGLTPDLDGLSLSLGNSGDALILEDALGAPVDFVAWEGFATGWTVGASTGDSIVRIDPTLDGDTVADWATLSPYAPNGLPLVGAVCGNGICEAGEDCGSCSDCAGVTGGKPANRYCCGDGVLQSAEGDGASCDFNP